MTTSIILAKILGIYFTILSIAMLANVEEFKRRFEGFSHDSALLFFGTIVSFIIGIILIVFHNVWVMDWRVLITLIAWLTFLKGVLYLFHPKTVQTLVVVYQSNRAIYITGTITLALGLFLDYKGFF